MENKKWRSLDDDLDANTGESGTLFIQLESWPWKGRGTTSSPSCCCHTCCLAKGRNDRQTDKPPCSGWWARQTGPRTKPPLLTSPEVLACQHLQGQSQSIFKKREQRRLLRGRPVTSHRAASIKWNHAVGKVDTGQLCREHYSESHAILVSHHALKV